jgi:plastocyanin
MDGLQQNHAAGISLIAFVIAVAASIGFYQFVYVPEASKKPVFPTDVIRPEGTTIITIAEGAANQNNVAFYVPAEERAILGVSNRVMWYNADSIAHTVSTDDGYRDMYSGLFDSLARSEEDGGPHIAPGGTFEFLFTKTGAYPYHCEPHPHMSGKVEIVENFT